MAEMKLVEETNMFNVKPNYVCGTPTLLCRVHNTIEKITLSRGMMLKSMTVFRYDSHGESPKCIFP